MNVEVLHEALLDIAAGVAFYDHQNFGAGDYFFEKIFEDIDSLETSAGIHEASGNYYRKIASRHPYLIYYRIVAETVEVVAVLDGRQRPSNLDAILRNR